MPAPLSFRPHRLHITMDEEDYLWLKSEVGVKNISEIFRQILNRLRWANGKKPGIPVLTLLRGLDMTINPQDPSTVEYGDKPQDSPIIE